MFSYTIPISCSPAISFLGAISGVLGGRNIARILLLVFLLLLLLSALASAPALTSNHTQNIGTGHSFAFAPSLTIASLPAPTIDPGPYFNYWLYSYF